MINDVSRVYARRKHEGLDLYRSKRVPVNAQESRRQDFGFGTKQIEIEGSEPAPVDDSRDMVDQQFSQLKIELAMMHEPRTHQKLNSMRLENAEMACRVGRTATMPNKQRWAGENKEKGS